MPEDRTNIAPKDKAAPRLSVALTKDGKIDKRALTKEQRAKLAAGATDPEFFEIAGVSGPAPASADAPMPAPADSPVAALLASGGLTSLFASTLSQLHVLLWEARGVPPAVAKLAAFDAGEQAQVAALVGPALAKHAGRLGPWEEEFVAIVGVGGLVLMKAQAVGAALDKSRAPAARAASGPLDSLAPAAAA